MCVGILAGQGFLDQLPDEALLVVLCSFAGNVIGWLAGLSGDPTYAA
jgi:hypothetical protein